MKIQNRLLIMLVLVLLISQAEAQGRREYSQRLRDSAV